MKQGIFLGNMRITKPEAGIRITIINILLIADLSSTVKQNMTVLIMYKNMSSILNHRDIQHRQYIIGWSRFACSMMSH